MEYADVKEFLDECVMDFLLATKERHLTNQIHLSISNDSSILIYDGMEIIADIMELEIKEEPYDGRHKYKYSFEYSGVTFISFENERYERFAGTDRKQEGEE